MDSFYRDLTPFSDFTDFTDIGAYVAIPDDWVVMCADVRGSTKAIEAGHYKDVNMVGAACITSVLNVSQGIEIPFVFGGDGAILVVPPVLRAAACAEFLAVQAMAKVQFDLDLRVGAVPVADVRSRGTDVRVRKYELSPRNYLAMFAGGGVELAETLLKAPGDDNEFTLKPTFDNVLPSLEGLSCRWEPLQPRGGVMLTMMVKGLSHDAAGERKIMGDVLSNISDILGTDPKNASPTSVDSMKFRWPPSGAKVEALLTAGKNSFFKTYLWVQITSLILFCCNRFEIAVGSYDGATYPDELRANTDYRKYDDMLRMVLDVSEVQANDIDAFLQKSFDEGSLVYGTHRAATALMTCVVFSLEQSEHVHFVDGADGGFAMAAVGFKQRLASKSA